MSIDGYFFVLKIVIVLLLLLWIEGEVVEGVVVKVNGDWVG